MTRADNRLLLDQADRLALSAEHAGAYGNELAALRSLADGLVFLANQVAEAEERIAERLGWEPGQVVTLFGRHPAFGNMPQGLLSSFFLWYPVSLCNYVRLTGWLAHDGNTSQADAYLRRVVPDQVIEYRNKVAAHFALVDPRPIDTAADREASVMLPITFLNGRLVARGFRLAVSREGEASKSTDLMWSVTETHEILSRRYEWPTRPAGRKPPLPPLDRA